MTGNLDVCLAQMSRGPDSSRRGIFELWSRGCPTTSSRRSSSATSLTRFWAPALGAAGLRQRKDHMEVRHFQEVCCSRLKPLRSCCGLALGAMAITARVVGDGLGGLAEPRGDAGQREGVRLRTGDLTPDKRPAAARSWPSEFIHYNGSPAGSAGWLRRALFLAPGPAEPYLTKPYRAMQPRARQTAVKTAAGAPWQIPPPCSRQALSRSTEGCGKRPVAQRVSSSGGRPTGGVYSGDGASFGHRLGHDNEARYMGPQWLEMTHLKGHSMEGLP